MWYEESQSLLTCHQTCTRKGAGPRNQGADLPVQRAQAPQKVPGVGAQADLKLAVQIQVDQEAEAPQKAAEARSDLCQDQGHAQTAADLGAGVDLGVQARVQCKPQGHQARFKHPARQAQFKLQDLLLVNLGIAARA